MGSSHSDSICETYHLQIGSFDRASPIEHGLNVHAEYASDSKRGFQRGRIPILLNRNNRLSRHTDRFGQRGLSQAVLFAQCGDLIADAGFFCHGLQARAVQHDLARVFNQCAEHQTGENRIEQQITITRKQVRPQ